MIQEIITYAIITVSVIYTVYGFVKFLFPPKGKKNISCSGGCSGCSLGKSRISSDLGFKQINLKK